jgi:hypothetical protein
MPIIPALVSMRENDHEFKASLGYIARPPRQGVRRRESDLKFGNVSLPVLFFKIILAVLGPLRFHINNSIVNF